MAEIPDQLLNDIVRFFDENQGAGDEQTAMHDKFLYAIDICSPKVEKGNLENDIQLQQVASALLKRLKMLEMPVDNLSDVDPFIDDIKAFLGKIAHQQPC
jgi:hypothetical protein